MSLDDRIRWNLKLSAPSYEANWAPEVMLASQLKDLAPGHALELACGIGANALFLAKRGWTVDAVDQSDVAIERLRRAARSEGVSGQISLHLSDARAFHIEKDSYDLVVCIRFLDRSLLDPLAAALKPGGLLLFKTFTTAHLRYQPRFPEAYCLEPDELPSLFPSLAVVLHEENDDGQAATSTFVGRRRS